jgi:Zn-dependent protease with chaperone function
VRNLGWTVLHASWQITLIGGATAAALAWLRGTRPEIRAHVAAGSLLLMVLVPAVTACLGETALGWQMRRAMATSGIGGVDLGTLVEVLPGLARDAALVWIAGASLGFLHLAVSYVRARQLATHDTSVVSPEIRTLVAHLAASPPITRSVEVRFSTRVGGPLVLGWRRPRILLPPGAVARLSSADLAGILSHELAHVRRRDYVANLIQAAIDRLLFFHPAAWWVSARIREEREYCCDDAAIGRSRDAANYAHALAALDDARGSGHLAVAARSGTLLHRIERLAGRSRRGLTPLAGVLVLATSWGVAAALLALLITVPPSLPPGSKLRRRQPSPAGAIAPRPRSAIAPSSSR